MTEKNIKSRIINKHDTFENWNKAVSFIPKNGEIIIYINGNGSDITTPLIKIGDGVKKVSELPFQGSVIKVGERIQSNVSFDSDPQAQLNNKFDKTETINGTLLGTQKTTTVGIDTTVTQGSNNLITSGAVYSTMPKIELVYDKNSSDPKINLGKRGGITDGIEQALPTGYKEYKCFISWYGLQSILLIKTQHTDPYDPLFYGSTIYSLGSKNTFTVNITINEGKNSITPTFGSYKTDPTNPETIDARYAFIYRIEGIK